MDVYDEEVARARFLALGCSPEDADTLVSAGIDPDIVGTGARDAVGFASAAVFHDLADPNRYLQAAGGDPDEAWRQWAKDSVESPGAEDEENEDEEDDGGDGAEEDGGGDDDRQGWASAYISSTEAGECSIELIDDLGMPGNATYLDTLTFCLPAAAPAASHSEHDARIIKAATEELAHYGCIPDSDVHGSSGSFSLVVRTHDRAWEWFENQRPVPEKLQLLLAALQGLPLDDLTIIHTDRDHPRTDHIPQPQPDTTSGTAQTSVVDWRDRDEFVAQVAAAQPDSVGIERYQGGWAHRLHDGKARKHPSLRGLRRVWAEAVRRDGELSGFAATFRSGDVLHRYRMQADWVDDLHQRLNVWEDRVNAVREEQSQFPHLKRWGKRLYQALLDDNQFMAATTPQRQDDRCADLARTMFAPDCPLQSPYIQRALAQAKATRADIIGEHQRTQWQAAIPTWAAQLAASAAFQQGTTAERAMLASNLLYTHHPSADTPELVRSLRNAAADLLG
ncbi:hypothetical protein [Streptomyces sp900105755]|uniref:Uncharacterized protein n=1 Tax=Streptomyces sp. 900105755 TaxID=3154389 RepID=A0ABV1TVG2_9ACTN